MKMLLSIVVLLCIHLYSGKTRRQTDTLEQWKNRFYYLEIQKFSPDGKWLVVRKSYRNNRDTLMVFSTGKTPKLLGTLEKMSEFSFIGSHLLASGNKKAELWNLKNGEKQTWEGVKTTGILPQEKGYYILDDRRTVRVFGAHQNEQLRYSDIEELKTGKEALVVWRRNKDNADEVLSIREGKPVRIYQASHPVKALEISPSGKRVIIQEQGEKSGVLTVHQVDITGQNSSETTIEDIGNDFVKLTAVGEENAWGITAIKQSKNKNPGPDIWYGNDHQLESKIDGEISYRHWIWKGNSGSIDKLPAERFSTVVSLNAARYYMVFNENQERDYTRQFPMIKPFLYDREKDHYEPLDKMTPEVVLSRFGKYMVYRNAAAKWWLLEVAGMKKIEIAGQDKSNPLFSKDSRWIYFESKDGLCIYDIEASVMKTAPQTKGFEIKILNAPKKMLYEKTGFDFSSKVMEDEGILLVSATDAQDNRKIFWEMKDGTWRKVTDWAEDNIKMLTKATERDRYVYIRENLNIPPELRVKDRNEKSSLILFKSNGHDVSGAGLKKEMLTYTNSEGKNLKAILYYPAHFSSEKKYPMIVHVYERQSRGSNQYLSPLQTFPIAFNIRVMLEKGYFVMMPDVVSDASGVGLAALSNVHAALDQVADHPNIDQEKLALIGHSFGGYLTNFIATHSTRFTTYISGAGAADITRMYFSYNETSGNPFYWQFENGQYPMWGPFSENKDVYHANNPILFAEKVSAPMLLWAGKEDKRIDAGQVMEFYIGLVRNKKEVVALFYPGQRHVFTRGSAEEKDLSLKIMEWLDYFLQNKKNIPWIDRQMKKNTER